MEGAFIDELQDKLLAGGEPYDKAVCLLDRGTDTACRTCSSSGTFEEFMSGGLEMSKLISLL
jgi:hypothetical protein